MRVGTRTPEQRNTNRKHWRSEQAVALLKSGLARTCMVWILVRLICAWAITIRADLEPLSGRARWRKDWISSELAQDSRAWSAPVRDVVNSIGDTGSTRPG